MFQKAIQRTINDNMVLISLWVCLLIMKIYIWSKIFSLSFMIGAMLIFVLIIKYVQTQPTLIWILPTFIVLFLQIIYIIDIIKYYYMDNIWLCISLVVARDILPKDELMLSFNLFTIVANYINSADSSSMIIPVINSSFIIVTIIIKQKNIWLKFS